MAAGRLNEAARRRQQRRNWVQAVLLLGGMLLTLGLCAWLLFGRDGLLWAVVLGVGGLALRPRMRPEWVLRMYRARPLPAAAAPEVHQMVQTLASRAGLPHAPAVYYVPTSMLNAFAVGGRAESAIGITDGLVRNLTGRQLAGVLAHEISHIHSDDLWIMTLADTVGRITHAVAYAGLLLMFLGLPMLAAGSPVPLLIALVLVAVPTVVTLLQLALSRAREFEADLDAVAVTNDPVGLAEALRTLHAHEGRIWERILVPHRRTPDPLLLRTHPSTEERVRRLLELSGSEADRLDVPPVPFPPAAFSPVMGPPRLRAPGIWR
jgi:heat shock protein HtpX